MGEQSQRGLGERRNSRKGKKGEEVECENRLQLALPNLLFLNFPLPHTFLTSSSFSSLLLSALNLTPEGSKAVRHLKVGQKVFWEEDGCHCVL